MAVGQVSRHERWITGCGETCGSPAPWVTTQENDGSQRAISTPVGTIDGASAKAAEFGTNELPEKACLTRTAEQVRWHLPLPFELGTPGIGFLARSTPTECASFIIVYAHSKLHRRRGHCVAVAWHFSRDVPLNLSCR